MSGVPPLPHTARTPLALFVSGVAHRYGQRWALRGVSLEVPFGEVLAIVGPNGCGKSTLLRVVATALRPTRGDGFVAGFDLRADADQVRRIVALLSHDPALYADLTADENLAFAMRMLGHPVDRQAIARVLDRVGLAAEGDTRARFMSSGMQRRLSIARLLLRAPRVLLLDEPYNSLDTEGVALISEIAAELRAAGGAVLLVAHDLERGRGLEDRVIRMVDGMIVSPESAAGSRPPLMLERGAASGAVERRA
ncbi:MAG: heme ABC exporter ATP-binding protein CcmA [Gemmatimonadaceae bacterium]|nr:heme ABC exporter ATP-binding protein CcmA [Gemmatimonadaceae bacterium]